MVKIDGEERVGVIVNCKICGVDIEVKDYMKDTRKFCDSQECRNADVRDRMREYRKTDRGRAAVKMVNQMYKRPELERECRECGGKFMSSRVRVLCDSCKGGVNRG